jgi:hypothetical protein
MEESVKAEPATFNTEAAIFPNVFAMPFPTLPPPS